MTNTDILSFNTSNVSVEQGYTRDEIKTQISFNTSNVSVEHRPSLSYSNAIKVSIHQMYRLNLTFTDTEGKLLPSFNTSNVSVEQLYNAINKIANYCFNTSNVSVEQL